jgi:superkiller protein 3
MTRLLIHLPAALVAAALLWLAAPPAAAQPPASPEPVDGAGSETAADTIADPSAIAIPRPDLSAMEPVVRRRIEEVQAGIAELLARPEPPRRDVGQAIGFLGQALHALDLRGAAVDAYRQARDLVPGDPRWSYLIALALQAEGELETAVAEYRRFLDETPQPLPAAHLRLGEALLGLGRLDEAEAAFRRAAELAPEEAAAASLYGLGRIAAERGDAESAASLLEQVLAGQPQASVVHYPLAQAYRSLGREPLARYHLALQGEREVGFADPLGAVLGSISKSVALEVARELAVAEDFDEASFLGFVGSQLGGGAAGSVEPLRSLIEQRRGAGASVAELGRLDAALGVLLVRSGDDAAAVEALERAVAGDPELVDARLLLGNALARSGRFADALERYDQVLARRPDSHQARVQRGAVRANLGQLAEARQDLETAVEGDPDSAEAHLRLGGVLLGLGEVEAAQQALTRAAELEAGPRLTAEARTVLAEIARRSGDLDAAAESYTRALDADPRFGPAVSGLAGLLGQAGRYRESATLYRRLVEEQPDNRMARMGEITALVLAGADAAARERLEAAVAHAPDDLNYRDVLARHLAAASDPSVRDGARAVELAESLFEQVPSAESMETLAMAHAQAGNFERAIEWQQRLLDEFGDRLDEGNLARLRAALERYRQGLAPPARGGEG